MTIGLTQYQLLLLQCERVCFVRCMLFINDDINGISFLYMYIYCVRKLRRTYIHVHSTSINIQHVHGSCKCVSSLFSVFTCDACQWWTLSPYRWVHVWYFQWRMTISCMLALNVYTDNNFKRRYMKRCINETLLSVRGFFSSDSYK